MDLHWYAVKIFWNRNKLLAEMLEGAGVGYYMQRFIPTLVFIHCTEAFIVNLRREQYEHLFVYADPKTRVPCIIPEREMTVFRLVTSAQDSGLEVLGDDLPKYHEGDLVRVLAGPFKGAEGHVVRIKRDRRVVISITGVVAVATTHIHPSLLEVLTPSATPVATASAAPSVTTPSATTAPTLVATTSAAPSVTTPAAATALTPAATTN